MSVLTMMPLNLDWYEDPTELTFDCEPDPAQWATEALTVTAGSVWWTASAALDDEE